MWLDAARLTNPSKTLSITLTILALMIAGIGAAEAQREDPGLRLACAGDYFRLCSGVDPGSAEAETCMDRNRPRLSAECRAAIGDYNARTETRAGPRQR